MLAMAAVKKKKSEPDESEEVVKINLKGPKLLDQSEK